MKKLSVIVLIVGFSFVCLADDYGPRPLVEGRRPSVTWIDKFQGVTEKPFTYYTPYGDIEKGAIMTDVMDIFGIPLDISTSDVTETWKYKFGEGQYIYVHFVNSFVLEITDRGD